jgi:malonate-semialdehyde dehydrogenase (acetylating)/methylmalonate-semialdehyde dehydrogenase
MLAEPLGQFNPQGSDMTTSSDQPPLTPPAALVTHFIDGSMVASEGARRAAVYNPAHGTAIRQVVLGSAADVEKAVAAGVAAQPAWGNTPALRRARVFFRFKELLERYQKDIARTLSQEHGKTLGDAQGEVQRGLEVVEFVCGAPQLLKGEYSENVGTAVDSIGIRQPLGIVAGITPFNFPAMVPLWMFPVALACGNAFILKPSERDPSVPLLLAELLQRAGLPDGLFNVVQGDREVVEALIAHPRIAAISFVGSTPVARHIHTAGSALGKRVQALGGAKNHAVVLPDADLDGATEALIGAAYGSAGERCMAISVAVVVGEATADALVERLVRRIASLKVGAPDAAQTDMGPLVSAEAAARVRGYIQSGVDAGARLLADGRGLSVPGCEQGFFVGPTLFDHVTPAMRIYREEIFGPVLSVLRVPTYAAAIDLLNGHEFANGTALFTASGAAARAFVRDAEVGMVGINVPIPVPMAFHSFGGWRNSMFGDHHMHGPEGIRFYTRLKTVTQRWPGAEALRADFIMPTME